MYQTWVGPGHLKILKKQLQLDEFTCMDSLKISLAKSGKGRFEIDYLILEPAPRTSNSSKLSSWKTKRIRPPCLKEKMAGKFNSSNYLAKATAVNLLSPQFILM